LVFLMFYGLVLSLFNSIWTLSVALNGAAIATVLAYSSAGFSALLGWALLKESLGWAKILAVVASMGGCVLVSGALEQAAWDANTSGILFGVFSGLFYAGYSLMGRSASQRGLNPWTTLLYTFSFAALFLMVFNLIPGDLIPGTAAHPAEFFWLGDAAVGWGILILLAAGPTVAGFGLINVSLGFLPSSVTTLILTTEPVFTAVTAYFILGELLTGVQMGGGLLILAGVVVLTLWDKPTPVEL
jgi:drug/metabolite transporter (DMT)-like permease